MRQIILFIMVALGGACMAHWTPAAQPVTALWHSISARSGGCAWAAGDNGMVYATTDGGYTWSPQLSLLSSNLLCVDFSSAMVGWVVGENGDAAHTYDGGAGWSPVGVASDDLGLGNPDSISAISAPDDSHAWALARWADTTVLYHTSDAGVSWSAMSYTNHGYSSPNTLFNLAFSSNASGWLVGSRYTNGAYIPVLLRTVDTGATWQTFDAPATSLNSSSSPKWEATVQAVSANLVWLHIWDTSTSQGTLFRLNLSTPPSTWSWNVYPWNSRVRSLAMSSSGRGILVGDATWETPDLFGTIHRTLIAGTGPLAADFTSVGVGYAAGPDGMLYRWTPDIWGDADQNGRVDLRDACSIAVLAAGGTPASSVSRALSDVDGSGQVTVTDAARALRIAAGLSAW